MICSSINKYRSRLRSKHSRTGRTWAARRSFSHSGGEKNGKEQKGGRRGVGRRAKGTFPALPSPTTLPRSFCFIPFFSGKTPSRCPRSPRTLATQASIEDPSVNYFTVMLVSALNITITTSTTRIYQNGLF